MSTFLLWHLSRIYWPHFTFLRGCGPLPTTDQLVRHPDLVVWDTWQHLHGHGAEDELLTSGGDTKREMSSLKLYMFKAGVTKSDAFFSLLNTFLANFSLKPLCFCCNQINLGIRLKGLRRM